MFGEGDRSGKCYSGWFFLNLIINVDINGIFDIVGFWGLEIYGYSKVCVGWDVSFKNSVYEISVVNGFVMW